MRVLVGVILFVVSFAAGSHHGYWTAVDELAASNVQQRAERVRCWRESHDENCITADVVGSGGINED